MIPGRRSSGIGRQLLATFRAELRRRGIDTYTVTVHEQMAEANRFYAANGLVMVEGFRLYGVRWNRYVDRVR